MKESDRRRVPIPNAQPPSVVPDHRGATYDKDEEPNPSTQLPTQHSSGRPFTPGAV